MRLSKFWLATTIPSAALVLDINSRSSIEQAAKLAGLRALTYYGDLNGNVITNIPGLLPQPSPPNTKYYWWETGQLMMNYIDYWHYTNDTTFNDIVMAAMQYQIGDKHDYMPANQSNAMGNDDQVYWAFAAMTAAEYNFPNPAADKPSWLALAQAVFNEQVTRWDTTSCGGGLRWQVYPFSTGYDYKNSPSNMGLFNLAARLGAYTKNSTYTDWAVKLWNWQASIGLVAENGTVYDGSDDTINCTQLDHTQWSYVAGQALHGASVMYVLTNSSLWKSRVDAAWNASSSTFFIDKVMTESACEQNPSTWNEVAGLDYTNKAPVVNCNTDQVSFKSSFARFIAASTKYAPWLTAEVMPYLQASAVACAATCTGIPDPKSVGIMNSSSVQDSCGTVWTAGAKFDVSGCGQEMSAMAVFGANLIEAAKEPVSNTTGGTSIGDPSAGTGDTQPPFTYAPLTTADKAGAGVLTAVMLLSTIGLTWYIC